MEMMIHIGGKCNLACPACSLQWMPRELKSRYAVDVLSLDRFKDLVEECLDVGITKFNLTGVIGEPLIHKDFEEYCEYLNVNDRVEMFTFFTSLTTNKLEMLDKLIFMSKLKLVVSVSGTTVDRFMENVGTNKVMFHRFIDNVAYIIDHADMIPSHIQFFIRYKEFFDGTSPDQLQSRIIIAGKLDRFDVIPFHESGNWAGLIPDSVTQHEPGWIKRSEKKGICGYALNEQVILPNGDVLLCGATDVEQKTVLGNVEDGIGNIYKEGGCYHQILRNQEKGIFTGSCEGCSEHHPIDADILEGTKKVIPWL
jgi:radical SAM protein with 4Fe4S-binding SPASM domain